MRAEERTKGSKEERLIRMGFYTTCFVYAESANAAIEAAVAIVDEKLKQIAANKANQPWCISAVETRQEATESNDSAESSVSGFAWYIDEDTTEN